MFEQYRKALEWALLHLVPPNKEKFRRDYDAKLAEARGLADIEIYYSEENNQTNSISESAESKPAGMVLWGWRIRLR